MTPLSSRSRPLLKLKEKPTRQRMIPGDGAYLVDFEVGRSFQQPHQSGRNTGVGFMPMKRLTFPKANLLFLLSAVLTLCTAPAVCRQVAVQLPFQTQTLASQSSEISDLLKQAQNGDRHAQFNLASRYLQGVEVPQDYKNAAMWYERAAEQGFAAAQFMMGFLYEQGKGVQRDYAQALNYYRAAADQGHSPAANNLGGLYLHGFGVPKNIGTALKWYQLSAERGGAIGQYNLATIYFVGKGVPKDYREAARWFRAAAEQGFPAAESSLAFLYFTGEGVVQDYGEAFKWMSRAAEQGYAQAQINLGDLYIEGKGVPLDYVNAYMWYSLGSAGDPRAAIKIKNLSRLITSKQRIDGENRASAWLSSHRSLDSSRSEVGFDLRVPTQGPPLQ
jgi:TPR repeat protein